MLWGLAAAGLWGSATGCVETAECTATLGCPGDEVCYEYRCRVRCEDASQCLPGQVCAPCQQIKGTHDPGKCFGEDLNACVEK